MVTLAAVGATVAGTATIVAAQQGAAPPAAASSLVARDSRLFQLRMYTAAPGKLDALTARLRDVSAKAFKKAGMDVIGYWLSAEKPDTVVYMLAFKDRSSAERSWNAFLQDAELLTAIKMSEVNGPLIAKIETVYMDATSFSPLK